MNTQDTKHVIVRSVIELETETTLILEHTKSGRLASDIRTHADGRGYLRTPDGWFVPIRDLLPRIEDVSEFLHARTLQHEGEFEMGGGFEILTGDGKSLGLPRSSLFPFAMDLAETIINLRDEGDVHSIFVGNQDIWDVSIRFGRVKIEMRQLAARDHQIYELPHKALVGQLKAARLEVTHFVAELEPLLSRCQDVSITSELIRQMFGLQKQF